jgi:hypothetical protein
LTQSAPALVEHIGGCHCGRVRFTVIAPADIEVVECNCSICAKSGFLHLIVPQNRFTLLHGSEILTEYKFNTGVAQHLFCKLCGIKSFYVPRSHPDGYSVNVRCLDPGSVTHIKINHFDGRHWEEHAGELSHLAKQNPDRVAAKNH